MLFRKEKNTGQARRLSGLLFALIRIQGTQREEMPAALVGLLGEAITRKKDEPQTQQPRRCSADIFGWRG